MTVAKKQILVENNDWDEIEVFPTIKDAEKYLNDCVSDGVSTDDLRAYEISKEFCLEETTTIKLSDDC